MLAPLDLLQQLQARLDEALCSVPCADGEGLASLVLALPSAPAVPPDLPGPKFALLHGRRGEMRAGFGIAHELRAAGPNRLNELGTQARTLSPRWQQIDPDETGFHGFALLGFAADPDAPDHAHAKEHPAEGLPNALLWVPELALWRVQDQAAVILTTRLPVAREGLRRRWLSLLAQLALSLSEPIPEPLTPGPLEHLGSLPELRDWQRLVDSTLYEIHDGSMTKAVLSRRIHLRGHRTFDLHRLQCVLTWLFPACQVLRIAHGSGNNFLAATPERLLRIQGCHVEVDAIAGTAARSADSSEDAALTEALMQSDKERREHDVVVEVLRRTLCGHCTQLRMPNRPRVLQLHNTQHLWTPIEAQLAPKTDLFHLAEHLHPTPATNGHPKEKAREWLRQVEPMERGWYTGAAGILEPDLSGELWVLLRCAEVAGNEARLYAGAGIVAGSSPLSEWRETGHKLSAMATALRFA